MISKIEHTAIIVKDMDESITYYTEMFGLKVRTRGQNPRRDMAFLYHENQPGYEIELIQDLVPINDYSAIGIVNHLAFTVDSIENSIHYYQEKGVRFKSDVPNIAIDGAKTIFFDGPNGELLQLVQPVK